MTAPGVGAAAELQAMRRAVSEHERLHEWPARGAAVLATLVPLEQGLCFLFERRPEGTARFAGHLSFPGGKVEAGDASALAAALREAEEEIGFAAKDVEVLGHVVETNDPLGRPVTCFLGRVDPAVVPDRAASAVEVDEIILVPVADLLAPRPHEVPSGAERHLYRAVAYESRMLPSQERIVQYWSLVGPGGSRATLWGFTGGLVAMLLNRAFDWEAPAVPRIVPRWEDLMP